MKHSFHKSSAPRISHAETSWAIGQRMSESIQKLVAMKTADPDYDKTVQTIQHLANDQARMMQPSREDREARRLIMERLGRMRLRLRTLNHS